MNGYKVTDKNMQCRKYQYEIGKTFKTEGALELCKNGFHFCKKLVHCFSYYEFSPENRVFEVIAGGDILEDGDKSVCQEITFIRELNWGEVLELCNSGNSNSGYRNSGNRNSGDCNSGSWNSGDWSSGNSNSGNSNSGDYNSGDYNSGSWNSGNSNSGNRNSGYRNSGNRNSGNRNSGSWNSGYYNSGFFNTNEPTVRMFNKETSLKRSDILIPNFCFFDLIQQVSLDEATEEEKLKYKKEIETSGGFLKTLDYKEAFQSSYNKLSEEERIRQTKQLIELPNFDADIFYEISGIDFQKRIMKEKRFIKTDEEVGFFIRIGVDQTMLTEKQAISILSKIDVKSTEPAESLKTRAKEIAKRVDEDDKLNKDREFTPFICKGCRKSTDLEGYYAGNWLCGECVEKHKRDLENLKYNEEVVNEAAKEAIKTGLTDDEIDSLADAVLEMKINVSEKNKEKLKNIREHVSGVLSNQRSFTKEEAEDYDKHLKTLYKPTGVNMFDVDKKEQIKIKKECSNCGKLVDSIFVVKDFPHKITEDGARLCQECYAYFSSSMKRATDQVIQQMEKDFQQSEEDMVNEDSELIQSKNTKLNLNYVKSKEMNALLDGLVAEKPSKTLSFTLTENQQKRFDKFKNKIYKKHGKYGLYEFTFGGDGLFNYVTVTSILTNKTKDLTELNQ